MKKNPFGKEGDFITAPNISRLFRNDSNLDNKLLEKSRFTEKLNLIELGAGNGEMMKVLIESFKFSKLFNSYSFIIREKSPNLIEFKKKN